MPDDADLERTRLLDGIESDLGGVEEALIRLDAGDYFRCVGCGVELRDEALADSAICQRCEACA